MESESDSEEITWNIVKNTVSNRMKHNSLIHKLIPFRKLNRGTKVMNAKIKKLHGVKTYSQYVEIKTSILRDLSENTDTDDESCFSEDDYNVLHKSDLSSNSAMHPAKRRRICSYKDYEIHKNDIESEETPRRKSLRKAKVGWRKVTKRNVENTFSESIEKTNEDNFMRKDTICSQTVVGNNNKAKLGTLNSENQVSVTNKVQNVNDPVNVDLQLLEQRHADFLEETHADRNTAMDEMEHESSKTEPSFICNRHEQKDSGIDEDTVDEIPIQDSKTFKRQTEEAEDAPTVSSVSPSASDVKNKVNENRNPSKAEFDKTQKCNLQPTITCTKIISNCDKYKIIRCVSLHDKHDDSSSKDLCAKEIHKTEEVECNVEDNRASLIGKRLQQSKNVNLSTDGDSSFGEDEERCSDVKNISDKVFERSQDKHLEIHDLNSKDWCGEKIHKIGDIEHSIENSRAIVMERRLQTLRNLNLTTESDSSLSENEESFSTQESMRDKVFRRSQELSDVSETEDESINFKHKVLVQFNEESQKDVNNSRKKENENIRTVEDLIQEDDLVLQTPSFRFQDLEENEFFIMDIPSMALENQLIGNKMVLTENMLELGGEKYRIDYRDIGNVSCVFGSANDKKSFEIANIKPEMRVVVRERIT